jgi:mono/diheme cytochrome c family protein
MKSAADRRLHWAALALFAAFVVFVWAALPAAVNAVPANQGAELFKAKCAGCHGPDGKGQSSMGKMMHLKDLGSAEVQKMPDKEIHDMIAKGKTPMPAFGSELNQAQINELVAYIRDLGKKEKH